MRCNAVDEEMLAQFTTKEQAIIATHKQIKEANSALEAELQRLQSEPSPLLAAQQRRDERKHDTDKFEKLIENLQALKASLVRKLSERQADLGSKQEALAAVLRENEALRARVAAQPVNKADLNRMAMERTKQKEVLEAAESQAEQLEHTVHSQEVQATAVFGGHGEGAFAAVIAITTIAITIIAITTIAITIIAITIIAVTIIAIFITAITANVVIIIAIIAIIIIIIINIRIVAISIIAISIVIIIAITIIAIITGVVRPGLERLCELYRTKAGQLGRDLLALREAATAGLEAVAERREENSNLEAQIARLEASLKIAREEQEGRVRGVSGRAERLAAEVDGLRATAGARAAEMEDRKSAVAAEVETLQRGYEAEVSRLRVELRGALEAMLQHRMYCQQRLEGAAAAVRAVQAQVSALPAPHSSLLAGSS
ncbi:uncharacterized protein HaLaN_27303, partial [Haematococcus lacustris]